MSGSWWLILLAGGSGSRMHAPVNKVFLPLRGKAVLRRSAEAFAGRVAGIVTVCRPQEEETVRELLAGLRVPELRYASGGETRQASVRAGLDALPGECTHVLIHDGARCLVDAETIDNVMEAALRQGSAVPCVPVTDTIRDVEGKLLEREQLRAMQTPQGFSRALIAEAHRAAAAEGFIGTDDAALTARLGHAVTLVPGSRRNLKITTPEDLIMAEAFLREQGPAFRIGHGYDVHRLVPERRLILCGVDIPHSLGLLGHSDADVALHALMDAMLGACALGDIGQHFPDSDPAYRGISSVLLLEKVKDLLQQEGWGVVNADVTIAAQKPKLLPYIPAMRQRIADALGLPVGQISVKATTTEHLGFEGEEKGISATAVALVQRL